MDELLPEYEELSNEDKHPMHDGKVFDVECLRCQDEFRAMRALVVLQDDGMFTKEDEDEG